MTIDTLALPYPDFKLADTMDPEEFDLNNARIQSKTNEIIGQININTTDLTSLKAMQSQLQSVQDGASGADYVGATTIIGVSGNTVQVQMESLKSLHDSLQAQVNAINGVEGTVFANGSLQSQLNADLLDGYHFTDIQTLIDDKLSKAGGNITGTVTLDNSTYLNARLLDGTAKSALRMTGGDALVLGDSANTTQIFSSVQPEWYNGTTYEKLAMLSETVGKHGGTIENDVSITNAELNFSNGTMSLDIGANDIDFTRAGSASYIGQKGANGSLAFRVESTVPLEVYKDKVMMRGAVHFVNDLDVDLASTKHVVIGSTSGENIAIDRNEMQARNNGSASTLMLQREGGDVEINNKKVYHQGNITSGTSAPSGGSDGDIYIQY